MANWCPVCPCDTHATPRDGSMCPQEGCVTSVCMTAPTRGPWPCVSPNSHAVPGFMCHLPVLGSAHTCPQLCVSPPGSHPAASTVPLCCLCWQGRDTVAFLEATCRDAISPHRGCVLGDPDKQYWVATADPALGCEVSQPCCPLWVTGAAWPDPGRRWHSCQQQHVPSKTRTPGPGDDKGLSLLPLDLVVMRVSPNRSTSTQHPEQGLRQSAPQCPHPRCSLSCAPHPRTAKCVAPRTALQSSCGGFGSAAPLHRCCRAVSGCR